MSVHVQPAITVPLFDGAMSMAASSIAEVFLMSMLLPSRCAGMTFCWSCFRRAGSALAGLEHVL